MLIDMAKEFPGSYLWPEHIQSVVTAFARSLKRSVWYCVPSQHF